MKKLYKIETKLFGYPEIYVAAEAIDEALERADNFQKSIEQDKISKNYKISKNFKTIEYLGLVIY